MKSMRSERIKLPILNWLLFLFISSGVSVFHEYFQQSGKINPIEQVGSFSSTRKGKKHDFSPSRIKQRSQYGYSENIIYLSNKLDQLIAAKLTKPRHFVSCLPQNIILRYQSKNLASSTSEDNIDFIS